MAAVVAHEVRNPLAGMRGALQIVDRRLAPDSREREVIKEIIGRIDGLTNIVQDMLVFARPRPPAAASVPLQRLMTEIGSLLATDPQFARIDLSIDVGDIVITADREQLKLVLHNLLLNAAQAMQGRGRIQVRARARDGSHELRVQDSGPGIPVEVRGRLFEPFFTTKHRGTGLGLATARRALHAHGGTIDFEFPEGNGTVVIIRLPALAEAGTRETGPSVGA
jgi:two-component system sensor histidine kinase PilS (NtrC family)